MGPNQMGPNSLHALPQSPFSPVFDFELDIRRQSSAQLDRCFSERALPGMEAFQPLLQQILSRCSCTSPAANQLLQQLQRLRSTFSKAVLSDTTQVPETVAASNSPSASSMLPQSRNSLDIEAMACELLASGYLVQVRDGAQPDRVKNARSCLQNLRHRFIVCLGWRRQADAEPEYLPEPLVVEPRFRDQFAIAHPTAQYESLLQAVPSCFVGSVSNLEAVVQLLCEQMFVSYKMQGLPVPPWRTKQALLSKWAPNALAELALKIQTVRRLSIAATVSCSAAAGGAHTRDRWCSGGRPAAVHTCHAAVGSAPPASACHPVQASTLTALTAGGPQQLSQEQLMAIMPSDTQQQLFQACEAASTATGAPGSVQPAAGVQQATMPGISWSESSGFTSSGACSHATFTAQAWHAASGPGQPSETTNTPPIASAAVNAGCNGAVIGTYGVSPPVGHALSVLKAADSLSSSDSSSGTLKFTRKASAEWKNQRSSGRKAKGLLAAALRKPTGSRASFSAAAGASCLPYGATLASAAGPPAAGVKAADGPVQRSLPTGGIMGAAACEPLIRRTHYRASGEEPWRRITTVRWGTYATQQTQAASTSAVR